MKLVLTFVFLSIVLRAINAQFASSAASATAVAQVPQFGAYYPQQNYNYNYGQPGYQNGQYNNGFNVGGFGGGGGFNGAGGFNGGGWHMPPRRHRPPHHPHFQPMAPQHHMMPHQRPFGMVIQFGHHNNGPQQHRPHHQPGFNVNHPNYYNHNYNPAYPNQYYPDTINTNPNSDNQPTQTNQDNPIYPNQNYPDIDNQPTQTNQGDPIYPNQNYPDTVNTNPISVNEPTQINQGDPIYPNQNNPDTVNTNPNSLNQPTQTNQEPINQQPNIISPVPTEPTFIDLMNQNQPIQSNPQSPTNQPNQPTQTNPTIISPLPQPTLDSLISGTMSPPLSPTLQPTPSVTKPPCTNLNHNNYQSVIYPNSPLYRNGPQTEDPTEQIDPRRR